MFEVMAESQGNLVGLRASGKLTHQDYETVLIPHLEALIKSQGQMRLLFYMDEGFKGWELRALWDDAKFGINHKDDFEKFAVVGGARWIGWGMKLFAHLMKGQVKVFSSEQLPEAWDWLKS